MSGSPRSRAPSSTAVFAIAVAAAIVGVALILYAVGVNLLDEGNKFVSSLYPPVAVTSQGAEIRNLYTVVFVLAVAIFLVVEGLIIWTVVRYRRKPGDDTLPPQTHGNNIAEFIWTIVPTIIVIFLFFVSWQTLNTVDTVSAAPQTKIRAIAAQFQWQFDYLGPDGTTVVYTELLPTAEIGGGMVVPAGRTVQLELVSKDVIHAFYVPQFLFKRDVVPGRTNMFDFTVNESDANQTFRGQCAELCGTGHSIMLFDVVAKTGPDFDAWLAEKIQKANATPAPPPSGQPAPSGPAPSGAPQPSAGGGGGGQAVNIEAEGVKFNESSVTAPAGQPFTIHFENKDQGTPHNVAIHQGSPTGQQVFMGEVFPGVATKDYQVPALQAGQYAFVCSVHPTMTGTLTVQ